MIDANTEHFLNGLKASVSPCGSRVTNTPAPQGTDADFLVQVLPHDIAAIMTGLGQLGWDWEGTGRHYQDAGLEGFLSFRKGEVNLIVTGSTEFAKRHHVATALCTRLNLPNKQDRIAVFQAVLYAEIWKS